MALRGGLPPACCAAEDSEVRRGRTQGCRTRGPPFSSRCPLHIGERAGGLSPAADKRLTKRTGLRKEEAVGAGGAGFGLRRWLPCPPEWAVRSPLPPSVPTSKTASPRGRGWGTLSHLRNSGFQQSEGHPPDESHRTCLCLGWGETLLSTPWPKMPASQVRVRPAEVTGEMCTIRRAISPLSVEAAFASTARVYCHSMQQVWLPRHQVRVVQSPAEAPCSPPRAVAAPRPACLGLSLPTATCPPPARRCGQYAPVQCRFVTSLGRHISRQHRFIIGFPICREQGNEIMEHRTGGF